MIGGIAVGIVGVVLLSVRAYDEIVNAPAVSAPGTTTLDLPTGGHVVYDCGVGRPNYDVGVIGPNGQKLVVGTPLTSETIPRDGTTCVGVARFLVTSAGPHQVTIDGTDMRDRTVVVGRTAEALVGKVAPYFGLMSLGGLAAIVGFVLLLVGISRRKNAGPHPSATMPPGWHPDPTNPAMLRYWDGQRWTENVSPR